jgi:hypothetical protein
LKRRTLAYLNHGASAFFTEVAPTTAAATTMSLNSFKTQNFQFITYSGPKPKLTERREHTKTMPTEERELDKRPSTRPALTSCRAKDFNLGSGRYS